jgi:hypothetical protein
MNLIIEYFKSTNENRDKEYKACINENIKVSFIEKIFVFISDESVLDIESDKIEIIKLEERPSFKYLFEWCNENLSEQICIVANTDIYFDITLEHLKNTDLSNTFIALTRWDLFLQENQWFVQFYNKPWNQNGITTGMLSQDSWLFKTPIKIDERSNFLMGKPGCDNRIVQIYHENNYNVKNPSVQIVSKHLHISNYRTYNNTDMVFGPYLLVSPTNDVNIDSQKKTIPHF